MAVWASLTALLLLRALSTSSAVDSHTRTDRIAFLEDSLANSQPGGVMVWGVYSRHTLSLLMPINHRLNAAAFMSIVDNVHPFL